MGGTSAPAAPAAGAMSPQILELCLRNDGVAYEDANVQLGLKTEYHGFQGRLGLYIGNKTAAPLTALATQLSPNPALTVQASPVAGMVAPRQQLQQMFNVECLSAFGDAPQLALRFIGPAGPTQLVITLPILPNKFLQPLRVDGGDFFRRWKIFDGKELQQVFKIATMPLSEEAVERVMCSGLHFAQLKGVDPNTTNFVCCAWLPTKTAAAPTDAGSVLVRLEVNTQAAMCRLSVRSASDALNGAISKLVVAHLGKEA